jgi:hypothetical protein
MRKPGTHEGVIHRPRSKWGETNDNAGFDHFWRVAMKILDASRPERDKGLLFARMKGETHEA